MEKATNDSLISKQMLFTKMVSQLIDYIYKNGYSCTFGEAYRPPETAQIYAKKGIGIINSLHVNRLAIDLNIFRGNNLLKNGKDFEDIGKYWETLGGSWGGWFNDGNHFSLSHNGVK